MSTNNPVSGCRKTKTWVTVALVLAGITVAFSAPHIPTTQIAAPPDKEALAYGYSANTTTVAQMTTGSTSISCTGRCTYKAVYNGTFLTVYGKGFTPYEVIEFRLNEVYLGRSDRADANGDVATWFKRSISSGTYELYAHEAHTGKNSTRLMFVVAASEPQTTIASSTSPLTGSSSITGSTAVETPGSVMDDYSLAGVVVPIILAMIAMVTLMRRKSKLKPIVPVMSCWAAGILSAPDILALRKAPVRRWATSLDFH